MARTTRLNLKPLDAYLKKFAQASRSPNARGELDVMFKQWGRRYLAFTQRWFLAQSQGGGDWPALAASTKKAKLRKRKARAGFQGGRKTGILIFTGTLLGALSVGFKGNLFQRLTNGIRVGFDKSQHKSGGLTIAQLAEFHNRGKGKLPRRKIFVDPDARTLDRMAQDAIRAVDRIGRAAERRR